MKRHFYLGSLLAIPFVVVVLAMIPGCPSSKEGTKQGTTTNTSKETSQTTSSTDTGGKKKREAFVVAKTDGVIKGRVVYDGDPPKMPKIAKMDEHADKAQCHKGPDHEQTWIIGKDNAVENVVVFLEAPEGKYFAIDDKLAEQYKDDAVIDQPFCVYEPHIVAMFPQYRTSDDKLKETGQKLRIKNSGEISHNTKITGDERKGNPNVSENVNPKTTDGKVIPIKYQKDPLPVVCDKHNWMNAKVITFDHPFFERTDKDGNFEIKNVPSGVEFTIKTWHEEAAPVSKKLEVKAGNNDAGTLKVKAAS